MEQDANLVDDILVLAFRHLHVRRTPDDKVAAILDGLVRVGCINIAVGNSSIKVDVIKVENTVRFGRRVRRHGSGDNFGWREGRWI